MNGRDQAAPAADEAEAIAARLADVRARMARAGAAAGRGAEDVRLIAVTKFVEQARIAPALAAGVTDVGENRAQELTEKLTFFEQHGCTVHFIGQLQTNKIKYVCGAAARIHSVDRLPLAQQLQRRAAALGVVQDVLLQVNIGAEAQKGGVAADEALRLLDEAAVMDHLRVRGFMCVPPALPEADAVRPYFAALRGLLERAGAVHPELPLTELSMGMTHDFEAAICEGATMVRVGTGIFGPRRMSQV